MLKRLWIWSLLLCLLIMPVQAGEAPRALPLESLPGGLAAPLAGTAWAESGFLLPEGWEAELDAWRQLPVLVVHEERMDLLMLAREEGGWRLAHQLAPALLPLPEGGRFLPRGLAYYEFPDQPEASPMLTFFYSTGGQDMDQQVEMMFALQGEWRLQHILIGYREPRSSALLNGRDHDQLRLYFGEDVLSYQYLLRNRELLIFPLDHAFPVSMDLLNLAELPLDPVPLLHPALTDTRRHGSGGLLILRSQPSAGSRELARIADGRGIQVASRQGEWLFVEHDSLYGFVRAEFVAGSALHKRDR